jgi:hypothetical protein
MWLVLCEFRIDCRALVLLRKLLGEVKTQEAMVQLCYSSLVKFA